VNYSIFQQNMLNSFGDNENAKSLYLRLQNITSEAKAYWTACKFNEMSIDKLIDLAAKISVPQNPTNPNWRTELLQFFEDRFFHLVKGNIND
jgi:DNA-dependent RNA polymerase auxiliary subunit epsilon